MTTAERDILFEEKRSIAFFVAGAAVMLPLLAVGTYAPQRRGANVGFWEDPLLFFFAASALFIGLAFTGMSGSVTITPSQVVVRTGRKERRIAKSGIVWAIIPQRYSSGWGSHQPYARYVAPTGPARVRVEIQPRLFFLQLFGPFLMKSVLMALKDGTYILIPSKRPDDLLKALGVSAKPTF